MTPTQHIAQLLTCLFETGKPELSLTQVENLGDGRGYTCGWAGFTTADEEVVAVVEEYTRLVGSNHLSGPIFKELVRLKMRGDSSVSGLMSLDFKTHYVNAMHTNAGKAAYATIVNRLFGIPAQQHCDALGLKLPVSYAVMFDSVIQHGNDSDPDGVPAMLEMAGPLQFSSTSAYTEKGWLARFLACRKQTLLDPHNRDTAEAWRQSVSRVVALRNIVNENPMLNLPLRVVGAPDYNQVIEAL